MMIRVEMEHFNIGKRKRESYTKDYEVRDKFWVDLNVFVEKDEFSYIFKHNPNKIHTCRLENSDNWFKENCMTDGELSLWEDIKYENFGGFINIEHIFIVNNFTKKCVKIKGDYAYFYNKEGNLFTAKISDIVRDKIKVGLKCNIRVLANRTWIVTKVEETDTLNNLLEQIEDLKNLGYEY